MGGTTTTTSGQTNNTPWIGAQPYLGDVMGSAQNLYRTGAGSNVYNGPFVAPLDPMLGAANSSITSAANNTNTTAPLNYAQAAIGNNGLAPGATPLLNNVNQIGTGANSITTGQGYQNFGSGAAGTNLAGMASGAEDRNPFLQQALDANDSLIANRVNSAMSGMGRYGSGGHTDVLARSLAGADAPILAQAYNDQQNRRIAANSAIDQNTLAGLAGQTGVQGANIGNALSANSLGLSSLAGGMNNASGLASMYPSLAALQFLPGQMLGTAGSANQQRADTQLQGQIGAFNQQEQMPWTQLGRYSSGISGLSGLIPQIGSSATSGTSQQMANPWQIATGLGLSAARLFA